LDEELDYSQIDLKVTHFVSFIRAEGVKMSDFDRRQMSALLSGTHANLSKGWMRKKIRNNLWRATEHGFAARESHGGCDDKVNF
jgi:hypothetical protein